MFFADNVRCVIPDHIETQAHVEGETVMKMAKTGLGLLVLVMTIGGTIKSATAQTVDAPAAPVPSTIFTAKKVFVSNATGEMVLPPGNPDMTYNAFYAAMKSWGRYTLVSSPAEADMVIEIRFAYTHILQGPAGFGTNFEFRLRMLDPKSGIVLWAFTESMPQSSHKTKADGYFAQTLGTLLGDLKNLTNRNLANQ
jgi:hypothetical protein